MDLPDSPEDRRSRDEALALIAKRLAVATIPLIIVGALAHSLGVPWYLVLIAMVFIAYLVAFEA